MKTTLGIDLGTSELKLALVDADGALAGERRRAAGRVAAASALGGAGIRSDWWDGAACRRARAARDATPHAWAAVRRIGLSGQMHGAVLLDADGAGAAPRDPVERRRAARRSATS